MHRPRGGGGRGWWGGSGWVWGARGVVAGGVIGWELGWGRGAGEVGGGWPGGDQAEILGTQLRVIMALATGVCCFAGFYEPRMPDVPAIPTREGPGLYYVGVIDDLDVHLKQGYVFKGLVFDVSDLP